MKKLHLILLMFLSPLLMFGQVRDTFNVGQYAISTLGTSDYIMEVTVPTVVNSKYGALKAEEVVYVPSTAPNDTILTLANARTPGKRRAILQQRGSERVMTITVPKDSIIYASYGSGARPIIYGSVPITGWTLNKAGTNIYRAYISTDVKQVIVDDDRMPLSRYSYTYFNTITTKITNTKFIADVDSMPLNYYKDAQIRVNASGYIFYEQTVTWSNGDTLIVNGGTANVGYGIILMNKFDFIDSSGEWFYDSVKDSLYLFTTGGDSPANYTVRGSTTNIGILTAKNNTIVKNIEFKHQIQVGIHVSSGSTVSSVKIDNCIFREQVATAISCNPYRGVSNIISNNQIYNAGNGAIYMHQNELSTVSNNQIYNTGLLENKGIWIPSYSYNNLTGIYVTGIRAIGDTEPAILGANTIRNNNVYNSGYNGIYFKNAIVEYNYIKGACLSTTDGGGIYTDSPYGDNVLSKIIRYNVVDSIVAVIRGVPAQRRQGYGIYIDERSTYDKVENNTIVNAIGGGIFMHKPNNHLIKKNTIYIDAGNHVGIQAAGALTSNGVFPSPGSVVTENKIILGYNTSVNMGYSGGTLTSPLAFWQIDAVTRLMVSYNKNVVINGHGVYNSVYNAEGYLSFAQWQASSNILGGDTGGSYNSTALSGQVQRVFYNVNKSAVTYAGSTATDENGTTVTSFQLQPFTSKYLKGTLSNLNNFVIQ